MQWGRIGESGEVAAVILFLASDEASYVTGAQFMVEGGYPPSEFMGHRHVPVRPVMQRRFGFAAFTVKDGFMDKTVPDLATAVAGIEDGMTLMIGGFGGSGAPIELIHALIDRFRATGSPKGLTVINNNAGNGRIGIAAMIDAGMVAKMICSFPRSADPRAFTEKYHNGQIGLELVPQGTLAERIRAAGAGIPAFYTPTSFGTDLAVGKPVAEFDGRMYVQERWLKADAALIKVEVADTMGNLTYRKAARNFSPLMAAAARMTIVQASTIVLPDGIDAEQVVTPGIFVDRIVHVADAQQEEALMRAGMAYA